MRLSDWSADGCSSDLDRAISAAGKGYAPETVERVIRRCMQLLGHEGTSEELLLEQWYRDVQIMDIFEGSGQVQRMDVGDRKRVGEGTSVSVRGDLGGRRINKRRREKMDKQKYN